MGGDNAERWETTDDPIEPTTTDPMTMLQQLQIGQDHILWQMNRRKGKRKLRKFIKLGFCVLVLCGIFGPRTIPRSSSIPSTLDDPKIQSINPISTPISLAGLRKSTNHLVGIVATKNRLASSWYDLSHDFHSIGSIDIDAAGNVWAKEHDGVVLKFTNGLVVETFFGNEHNIASVSTYDGQNLRYTCHSECSKAEFGDGRAWKHVEMDVAQMSLSSDGSMWSVDSKDNIWLTKSDGSTKQVPGRLVQISAGSDNHVVGVNRNGNAYKRVGKRWERLSLSRITRAKAAVVSENGDLFVLFEDGLLVQKVGKRWVVVGDDLRAIAVSARHLVSPRKKEEVIKAQENDDDIPTSPPAPPPSTVLNQASLENAVMIFAKSGKSNFVTTFKKSGGVTELLATFPSSLRHMSMTDDLVTMAVGEKVFFQSWKNERVPLSSRKLYDKHVDAFLMKSRSWFLERGVLAVDTEGSCFVGGECDYYDEKANRPNFHNKKLEMMDVSHDGSIVWGVTKDDVIFEWKKNVWQRRSGRLVQVSVGDENHVWGLNRHGDIFEYIGRDKWRHVAWNSIHGRPSVVRVSRDGHVVALSAKGLVYAYKRSDNKWVGLPEFQDVKHIYLL